MRIALFVFLVFSLVLGDAFATDSDLASRCKDIGAKYIAKHSPGTTIDPSFVKSESFYSKSLDTCILARASEIGVYFEIVDLAHVILKDFDALLICTDNGAGSVLLDAVSRFHGNVSNQRYDYWADDGKGGPPFEVKTPTSPYKRSDCLPLFDGWLKKLR